MLYLLDANVLITAHSQYYPIDRVPEFWEWLAYQAELGHVKMPIETYEEVTDGSLLYGWVRDPQRKGAILLDEAVDQSLLDQVVSQGYAPDLTEIELEQVGFDPFLVAYGLASPSDRCVVTLEKLTPQQAAAKPPGSRRMQHARRDMVQSHQDVPHARVLDRLAESPPRGAPIA